MRALTIKAFRALVLLVVAIAVLLFVTAGTLDYWEGWTFLAVYGALSVAVTLYLVRKDPALLQRRMRGGPWAEKQPAQKVIMSITSLGFIGLLVVPALDHRFGWTQMPASVALAGDGLMALGWLAIYFVFRENSYTFATIELAPDQQVISTGPYAMVRHPMYAGALLLLLGIPIALGSWWGVPIVMAIVPALIWRLLDEERFLARNLAGYREYQQRVRSRLIPRVW